MSGKGADELIRAHCTVVCFSSVCIHSLLSSFGNED